MDDDPFVARPSKKYFDNKNTNTVREDIDRVFQQASSLGIPSKDRIREEVFERPNVFAELEARNKAQAELRMELALISNDPNQVLLGSNVTSVAQPESRDYTVKEHKSLIQRESLTQRLAKIHK